jgi:hypothetical protein
MNMCLNLKLKRSLRRGLGMVALFAAAVAVPARADVGITLDATNNTLSGNPGDSLTFFGEINNNTPLSISLDFPSFFLVGGDLPITYNLDFGWPDTVDANSSSGSSDLFSVNIPTTIPGLYAGTFELDGVLGDGVTPYSTTVNFTVDVNSPLPEPAEWIPCGLAFAGFLAVRYRRSSRLP